MSQLLDLLTAKNGYERTAAFDQYLKNAALKKDVPIMGYFELTPRCNLDCKMCYVHLKADQIKRLELTAAQWISLIDEACDAGMLYATLTGGECLLFPGFREIYEHLQSRGVLVSILTNGILLDEKTVTWLAERTPQRVQISVYGSSSEGYGKVTGHPEAFCKVDRAIDLMKESGIPFSLAITSSKQMIGDFEAVMNYCQSKKPLSCDVSLFPFEAREETSRARVDFALTTEEHLEISRIRLRLSGKEAVPLVCEEMLNESAGMTIENQKEAQGIPCSAGRIKFSISWDGRMLACNAFDFAESFPIKDGFDSAWRSINKKSKEYRIPDKCCKCIYQNVCLFCPALHWLRAGDGKTDNEFCSTIERMISEGIIKLLK